MITFVFMELINKLKSIFNVESTTELTVNTEYGFSINWIKPTKKNPNHIIFTSGLSDSEQLGAEKYPELAYIELYICLPEYWNIEDLTTDSQWPINWLNRIAELPKKNKTWFGPGDTIPAGNPVKALAPKFDQNHFILAEPIKFKEELKVINCESKDVSFLSLIPIFEAEMLHKTKNSAKVLLSKYTHNNLTEEIDEYRTSIIKNSKFNIFMMVIIGLCLAVGLTIAFKLFV